MRCGCDDVERYFDSELPRSLENVLHSLELLARAPAVGAATMGVQPAKTQRASAGNLLDQRGRAFEWHAEPAEPGIDLDEDVERLRKVTRLIGQRLHEVLGSD